MVYGYIAAYYLKSDSGYIAAYYLKSDSGYIAAYYLKWDCLYDLKKRRLCSKFQLLARELDCRPIRV